MARARPASRPSRPRSSWRRRFVLLLKVLAGIAILALGALVIAIYIARAQLPSFESLKSSPNGQMIRVHAADGSVIVSMGPSFGEWLSYGQIPAVMRDATVAVEDRRFRSHLGVDPVDLGPEGGEVFHRRRGSFGEAHGSTS